MSEVIENIKTKTIKNYKKQGNKAKDDSVKTAKLKVQNPYVSRISTLTSQGKRTPIKNRTGKRDDTKTCIAPPPAQQDPQRPTPTANGADEDSAKFDLWLNPETATPGPLTSVTSTATKVSRTAAKETPAPPLPTSAARTDQPTTQQDNLSKESIGNVGGTANQTTRLKPVGTESEETSISTSLETAKDISTIDPKQVIRLKGCQQLADDSATEKLAGKSFMWGTCAKEAAKYCFLNQPKQQKLVENPEKFGEDSTMTAAYQDFDLFEIKDNNKPPDIRKLEEFFASAKEKEEATQQPSVTNDIVAPARRPVEQSKEMRRTVSRENKDLNKNRKKQKKILRLHPSRSLTKIATLFKDKSKKKLKAKTQPTMQRS